ncbi:MAG: hypothetical protein WCR45_12345, partial [Bacteroidaceae bacterium]
MAKKKIYKVVSATLVVFLLVFTFSPCMTTYFNAVATIPTMPLGFEGQDSIAAMKTSGLVNYNNKTGVSEYSLNKDPLYSQSGNNSLKLSFSSTAADYDSNFKITLNETIAEADGISFWIYNPGNMDIYCMAFAATSTSPSVRYKYRSDDNKDVVISAGMGGFQKVTLRFDNFGLRFNNDDGQGLIANTVPTKDIIASFKYIELRVRSAKANQTVYFDTFEWAYDRDVVNFNDSDTLPSNVTVQGYLNNQPSDFCTYSITDSNKDSGKSLQVGFGSVDGESAEQTSDLNSAYRYIQVSIDTNNINLNGDALRLWLKNTSAANVSIRIRITDANGVDHRHSNGSYVVAPSSATVNNIIQKSLYSDYRNNSYIYNWTNPSGTSSLISDSQLQGAQKIDLFIFPRTVNNAGSLIIDGISVINPKVNKSNNERILRFDQSTSLPQNMTISQPYYSTGTYGIVSSTLGTKILNLNFNSTPVYTGNRYNESCYLLKMPIDGTILADKTDLQISVTNNCSSSARLTVALRCVDGTTTYYCKDGENESTYIPANTTKTYDSNFAYYRKAGNDPVWWVGSPAPTPTSAELTKAVELMLYVFLPQTVDTTRDYFRFNYVDINPTTSYNIAASPPLTNGTIALNGGMLTAGKAIAGDTVSLNV